LDAFFFRLRTSPRSITTVVVVADPIDPNGANGESVESHNVPPVKISAFHCADVAAPQL
jgi:hypothetical protein